MAYFLQYSDSGNEKRIEVHDKELLLGRSPDCGVVIAQPGISRHHCKISHEGDHYIIEDLQSKNGTRVNNVYINKAKLSDKDSILVAEYPVSFELHGESPRTPGADTTSERLVLLSDEKELHEEAGTIIRKANEFKLLADYEEKQKSVRTVLDSRADVGAHPDRGRRGRARAHRGQIRG